MDTYIERAKIRMQWQARNGYDSGYCAEDEAGAQKNWELPLDSVEVIFADDDEMLWEVVKSALTSQGILEDNITTTCDGLGAMEHILTAQGGDPDRPLLLLLDLQMPNMDGRECATRACEMARKGMLRRPPYVVAYSSHTISDPRQFHNTLPKDVFFTPGNNGILVQCLNAFKNWWRKHLSANAARWSLLDLTEVDSVIVNYEPMCRMALLMALNRVGMTGHRLHEAEDEEEALELFDKLSGAPQEESIIADGKIASAAIVKPVLVFLGRQMAGLASILRERGRAANQGRCEPYIVCVSSANASDVNSVDSQPSLEERPVSANASNPFQPIRARSKNLDFLPSLEGRPVSHCFLPSSFTPDDLSWVLQLFRLWWFELSVFSVGSFSFSKDKVGDFTETTTAERMQRPSVTQCSCDTPKVAEDLGQAMEQWRARKEKRRKSRDQLDDTFTYGAEVRRLRKMEKLTPDALVEVVAQRWPGQCKCGFSEKLGSGAQADVYLGKLRSTVAGECDTPVAVKVYRIKVGCEALFRRELEIGKSLLHPNLVSIYDGAPEHPLMLIQEYCAGGTVSNLLAKTMEIRQALQQAAADGDLASLQNAPAHAAVPTLAQRLKIALDVAKGMAALHEAKPPIVHRDLKSENVLLVKPLVKEGDMPMAKVADFGLARELGKAAATTVMTRTGTLRWMAPEVMTGGMHGLSADVYSYGVLLFEVLTGAVPYGEDKSLSAKELDLFVKEGGRPDAVASQSAKAHAAAPPWAMELMRSAWRSDPDERPSFVSIIKCLISNGADSWDPQASSVSTAVKIGSTGIIA